MASDTHFPPIYPNHTIEYWILLCRGLKVSSLQKYFLAPRLSHITNNAGFPEML